MTLANSAPIAVDENKNDALSVALRKQAAPAELVQMGESAGDEKAVTEDAAMEQFREALASENVL